MAQVIIAIIIALVIYIALLVWVVKTWWDKGKIKMINAIRYRVIKTTLNKGELHPEIEILSPEYLDYNDAYNDYIKMGGENDETLSIDHVNDFYFD